ncbi:conjugal transfer protein TraX [Ruminococcaceae bacterium OttesenSCG-928-I18]|nr:conjugal transfer protein TraX [Ruminococcaceae bacterium OttesenSCG-928-I18]
MGEQSVLLKENRASSPGGLSGSALKYIAIVAMFIDHFASAMGLEYYGPLGSVLHFIGRTTGPLMFFFIAEGYRHTRNVNRYTLRLVLFAILSYLPYIYYKTGALPTAASWMTLNVIYTLLMGHLALRFLHEVKNIILSWTGIFVCMVLASYGDWGFFAVAAILLFDMFRGNLRYQQFAFCLLTLLVKVLPPLTGALKNHSMEANFTAGLIEAAVACGMFVPVILLHFYNGRRGGANKWLFYLFYPAHLLFLGLLKKAVLAFSM